MQALKSTLFDEQQHQCQLNMKEKNLLNKENINEQYLKMKKN